MKICVTGGAGFIASHIADKYLELGHDVVILDNLITGKIENVNPKAKFIEIDITDDKILDIFKEEKFDILCHYAAQMDVRRSVANPKFDAHTNIVGGLNLYEAAKETGVKKIIFASSGGTVYGEQDYFPADENHPRRPCSPYGIAKASNELYLAYYNDVYGIKSVIYRYGNVYGARQNPFGEAGVIAIFAMKMLSGEMPIINGTGLQTRDYIHIEDVVSANVLALEDNVQGTYNVCFGTETNVVEILAAINKALNMSAPETHGEAKAGEQMRVYIAWDKINKDYGWKPKYNLDEGIAKTMEFFKDKYGK